MTNKSGAVTLMCLQTQNEPQAYEPFIADPNWICRRGTAMRPFVSNGVLLFSGRNSYN